MKRYGQADRSIRLPSGCVQGYHAWPVQAVGRHAQASGLRPAMMRFSRVTTQAVSAPHNPMRAMPSSDSESGTWSKISHAAMVENRIWQYR